MILTGIKLAVTAAAFITAGLSFLICGIYLGSESFLDKLSESRADAEEKRRLVHSGKICSLTASAIGMFTIVCGIVTAVFPAIFPYLALIYVCALAAAFCVINCCFSKK